MLENVAKITRVVLACGTVDLRKGIDGLSMIIGDKYKQNPFEISLLLLTVYSLTSIGISNGTETYFGKDLLRNSIVTPSLLASILNVKYVNSSALHRIE